MVSVSFVLKAWGDGGHEGVRARLHLCSILAHTR